MAAPADAERLGSDGDRHRIVPGSSVGDVWSLAWPVILAMLSESLVGLADMLMVARLGPDAVAAVGIGGQLLGGLSITMTAIGTGTLALVARHIGAGQRTDAELIIGQSLVAAAVLASLVAVPVSLGAESLVRLFGVDEAVVALGRVYVATVMLSVPLGALLFVSGSGLRGAGDTRTPLWIGVAVNVVNVIGNYALIFGHFGFPALGVRGSALATVTAFSFGALLSVGLLARGRLVVRLARGNLRPRAAVIKRILNIGYPAAAEELLMQLGFFLYLRFAIQYGTEAVAAYFIGVRIMALSFLPGFGFSAAAGALVGQNLGAGEPDSAQRVGWTAAGMAAVLMSGCGVVIFLFAEPIARLFTDDVAVVTATVWFIYALGSAQPFMAMDFTLGGALRGAGDTRFTLLSMMIAFYGFRLGSAAIVVHVAGLGLGWLWAALIADYIARSSLKIWRFRMGAWKHLEV